jgi:hypothetical protein
MLVADGGGVGDVREVGEATEDGSGNISPSNLCRFSLCFMVSCFSVASPRERLGGGGVFIYDFLGQDDQSGTKTDDIGGSMAKWARVA